MRKNAVKLTLTSIASLIFSRVIVFALSIIIIVIIAVMLPAKNRRGSDVIRDELNYDRAEITVTIARDGSALVEESYTFEDKAPEKNSHTDHSLVKTLSDGSLAFEYSSLYGTKARYYGVSVLMEGEDLSEVAEWSEATDFHGAAGFRDGQFVAFTTRGLKTTESFRLRLLLSGKYFGDLNAKIRPYKTQYSYLSDREDFIIRGVDDKAGSLFMYEFRRADKYLFFAAAAALILLIVLPLLSRRSAIMPEKADLQYAKGMQNHILLILISETALLVSFALNPFNLHPVEQIVPILLCMGFGVYVIMPTVFALNLVRKIKKEAVQTRDEDGYLSEFSAIKALPVRSAGRTVLQYRHVGQGRNSRTYQCAACQEDYYSLYRCPKCGRINLQLLRSYIEVRTGSEERSAKKLCKLVPSVSEALMGSSANELAVCLKAKIKTNCLACGKTPYWAVNNDDKAAGMCLFIAWAILGVLAFAVSGKFIEKTTVRMALAFISVIPALLLAKPLASLKHIADRLLSRHPSPRVFAGSLEELRTKAQMNGDFRGIDIKSAKEDYGDKWINTKTCSGTLPGES